MMIRQGLLWATIVGFCAWVSAQQTAQLDFFADAGRFEIDYNKDGREDFVSEFVDGGVQWAHITRSMDLQTKYVGVASQRIQLQRGSGGAGRYVMFKGVNFNAHLKPEVGEPLLVRVAIRAQGFQNATYQVYVNTGSRRATVLAPTSASSDWQLLSAVVPVELNASGQPNFALNIEISVSEGAAQGTLWIDEAQALSTRTIMRSNSLPNSIKLCLNFLYPEQDGYRYLQNLPHLMVIGTERASKILPAHYPNTIFAPYAYCTGSIHDPGARHNRDIYDYQDVVQNHPDWFLRDQQGQLLTSDVATYIDLGRPEVRERAWQSLRDYLNRTGRPRYVYLDGVNMRFGLPGGDPIPANYPNNNLWAQAFNGWFEYVGSRVRNEFGSQFIVNAPMGPGYWLRGIPGYSTDGPGISTLPYIGGFLIEHAFTHARLTQGLTTIQFYGSADTNSTPGRGSGPGNWAAWVLRNQVRLATEHPDKIVILMPTLWLHQPDTPQKLRFAIAGCLIVQHENTYLHIDPRRNQQEHPTGFYPSELFVPLGRWTENYRIVEGDLIVGGLFVRNYENGIVVWNPRSDRDYTFTLSRDLYDWDRNLIRAGTVVQIPRQTGHVFYSAPEITVELSPQNAQVLPGQTVQFTVTYRNRGTAPGSNVRIAVPLPQGMTLVGSNPTARMENGQVVWVVPNVPVGGQGTLQFTVRVE